MKKNLLMLNFSFFPALWSVQSAAICSKITFLHLKTFFYKRKLVFYGNKTLYHCLGASPKNTLFASDALLYFYLFLFFTFSCQKMQKAYFHQQLESVAPKCWLKYTTFKSTRKLVSAFH